MERLHLKVFGDVQAVGFRYSTIEIARDLGLTGWVRNNPDGSVQIVAEGEREKLENLSSWASKGPPLAKIDRVEKEWKEVTGEFSTFEVKY